MKICGDCDNFKYCPCCKHGWCRVEEDFYSVIYEACECYDGPNDEPGKPHYQTEVERDNPRDNVIERETKWI